MQRIPVTKAPAGTAAWIFAALLVLALLAVGRGHPIQDDNEGLYAQVALEMLHGGSWILPHLDGVPYLEKPPLLYWLTALSFHVFGPSEAAARAAPLLGALLVLSAVALFALRRLDRRGALLSVLVAASSPLLVGMSRLLMFDLLFAGLLAWSLVALHEARGAQRPGGWVRLSYACLALAVLTKGFAALAIFGLVVLFLLVDSSGEERRTLLRLLTEPAALALFAAIALPWHLLAQWREPRFAWIYLVNEHLLRFLGRREPHDFYEGPWWYYLPRIAAGCVPWIFALLLPGRMQGRSKDGRFLWAWTLVTLVFFSASVAKANYYMVVVLPALALLCGRRLAGLADSRWSAALPLAWIALLAGGAGLARLPAPFVWPAHAGPLCAAAAAIAASSLALFLLRRPLGGALACAAVSVPLAMLFSEGLAANAAYDSQRDLADAIGRGGFGEVYVFRDYERVSSLRFYLRRPLGVIDPDSGDLKPGLALHPDATRFPTTAQFLAAAHPGKTALVVTDRLRPALERGPLARGLHAGSTVGNVHLYEWIGEPAARGHAPMGGRRAAASP